MGKTKIEWTRGDDGALGYTWNPVRGCSRVSEGCRNCYAEKMAARFSDAGMPYEGLATRSPARWTGKVRLVEEHLEDPLKWRKPRRVFVNSMSDLFHEGLRMDDIVRVFKVMSDAPQHVFQVLTKRPRRMRDFMQLMSRFNEVCDRPEEWPLKNVWLGVSIEDQQTADERIPLLLNTPAAVRFVSAEPLLSPVDLGVVQVGCAWRPLYCACSAPCDHAKLDWVIVGGESGAGARRCDLGWLRTIVGQCEEANVPAFVKQLGSRPCECLVHGDQGQRSLSLSDRKGGDINEWPDDLRVRQFPQ